MLERTIADMMTKGWVCDCADYHICDERLEYLKSFKLKLTEKEAVLGA